MAAIANSFPSRLSLYVQSDILENLIPVNDILIGMHLNISHIAFFLHLMVTEAGF